MFVKRASLTSWEKFWSSFSVSRGCWVDFCFSIYQMEVFYDFHVSLFLHSSSLFFSFSLRRTFIYVYLQGVRITVAINFFHEWENLKKFKIVSIFSYEHEFVSLQMRICINFLRITISLDTIVYS